MSTQWQKHVFTSELPYEEDQVVTQYLREKFHRFDDFIMSLGQMSNIPPSRLLTYKDGKLVQTKQYTKNRLQTGGLKLYFLYIPKALLFVVIDSIRALQTIQFTCDIFFAQHFLPAFLAVVLRRFGILHCKTIVFWMFDFFIIPPEFSRSLYYRGMDAIHRYIRGEVDEIWYTTPRLAEVDMIRFGELPKNVVKRFTNACFFRRIKYRSPPSFPPLRLVFLGSLRINNAIYEAVEAVNTCIKHGMNIELVVIGSGPEEKRLVEYIRKKGIVKAVSMYGFIDNGKEIAKILSRCHLGLALYPADPYGPNWYVTSGKCRRYISQGLPVVVTAVPYFAKYIYDYNAGIIVDNDPEDVAKAIRKLYDNPSHLLALRKGVDKLYNAYKADSVLENAFRSMLNEY